MNDLSFLDKKRLKVFLVVGSGHSGSTLLDLLMSNQLGVCGVGELFQLRNAFEKGLICSCMRDVGNCDFWLKIKRNNVIPYMKVGRRSLDFFYNRRKFFYWEGRERRELNEVEYSKKQEEVYNRIAQVSKKNIIFDSSKSIDRADVLINNIRGIDFIIVHLVRDGRGVVYSYNKVREKVSAVYFMFKWFLTNLKTEILKIRHKKINKVFVLYKDLIADPEGEIYRILKSAGISCEVNIENWQEREYHQIGGNLKLRKSVKNQEIKRDLRWKKGLAWWNKVIFNLFFNWMNLYYKWK